MSFGSALLQVGVGSVWKIHCETFPYTTAEGKWESVDYFVEESNDNPKTCYKSQCPGCTAFYNKFWFY